MTESNGENTIMSDVIRFGAPASYGAAGRAA